jgi:prepilin-type N-terminal cleavage/methylation domain-containing protein
MKINNIINKNGRCQKGITLIELMIALFILGIITATAVPSMQSFLGLKNIEASAKIFDQSIRAARTQAIDRKARVSLRPIANGADWSGGWQMEVTDTAEVIRQVDTLASNLVVSSNVFTSGNPLIFEPWGAAVQTGSFTMNFADCSNDSKLFTFTILASGLAKKIKTVNPGC